MTGLNPGTIRKVGTAKKKTLCACGIRFSPLALVDAGLHSTQSDGIRTWSNPLYKITFLNSTEPPHPAPGEKHSFPLPSPRFTRAFPLFFTLNSSQTSHHLFTPRCELCFSLNLLTSFKHFPLTFPQFFTYDLLLSTIPQNSKLLFLSPSYWIFPLVVQVFLQIPQIHSPYYYYYFF